MRRTPSAVTNGTQIKRPYSSYSLGDACHSTGRRESVAIGGKSEAIGGQSDVIGGHRRAIRRHRRPSVGNQTQQTQSDALRGHRRPSVAITVHQVEAS